MGVSIWKALLPLAIVIGVTVGCGNGDGSSGGNAVRIGESTTLSIGAGNPEATASPHGPQALAKLPQLARAQGPPDLPAIRGSEGLTLPQWLTAVDEEVAQYWQTDFNGADFTYTAPRQVIFDRPVDTRCGSAEPDKSAFYCTRDQTVYLDLPYEDGLFRDFGDAAVAVSVAHENGHHIQNLLGIKRIQNGGTVRSHEFELQADCLAGVYMSSVYRSGRFQPGDYSESIFSRAALGDPPGMSPNDPQSHGSGPERATSFLHGYDNGRADAC